MFADGAGCAVKRGVVLKPENPTQRREGAEIAKAFQAVLNFWQTSGISRYAKSKSLRPLRLRAFALDFCGFLVGPGD